MATNPMSQTVAINRMQSDPARNPGLSREQPDDIFNFAKNWKICTSQERVTLFGFRRFRTSQLLNIRFLEDEIAKLDADIYQAGLKLGIEEEKEDRLGLRNAQRLADASEAASIITDANVQKLRSLIREYSKNISFSYSTIKPLIQYFLDEALISFNAIMLMEKSSLADSDMLSSQQTHLSLHEVFTTRILRVDLAPRSFKDPLRGWLHGRLRSLRFDRPKNDTLRQSSEPNRDIQTVEAKRRKHYRDSTWLAEISARLLVAFLAAVFFVVPLVILNYQDSTKAHLLTVSLCIIIFSVMLSLGTKASNQETMVACGGYAAVLVVFVSSSNNNSAA